MIIPKRSEKDRSDGTGAKYNLKCTLAILQTIKPWKHKNRYAYHAVGNNDGIIGQNLSLSNLRTIIIYSIMKKLHSEIYCNEIIFQIIPFVDSHQIYLSSLIYSNYQTCLNITSK